MLQSLFDKKFLTLFFVFSLGFAFAQKDNQNQTEFLKLDASQKDYNLADRKAISKPQMPHYDVGADSTPYFQGGKKALQQDAFMSNKYYFPAKPRNQWELGVGLGMLIINGDIKSVWNPLKSFGATFTVRKSLGYLFSLRMQYIYGQSQGRDWQPKANSRHNPALNGGLNANVNYFSKPVTYTVDNVTRTNKNLMFKNYKTTMHEASLQGVLTLGNVRFHKERNIVNAYLFLGVGALFFDTKLDALDANGQMYDYSKPLSVFYSNANNVAAPDRDPGTLNKSSKKLTNAELKALYDNKFESNAGVSGVGIGIGAYQILPSGSLGAGLGFHISKRVTLNVESRFTITGTDLLDGDKFQENAWDGLTPNNDNLMSAFVTANIHLGKKSLEPMWWLNPMDYTYKKLGDMDPDKIVNELLQDDDEDGVPNRLDKELKTKKGCPVDVKGVALDSDKDGIADCDDKEPYSPPGCPIDASGVSKCPSCCDNLPKNLGNGNGYDCTKMELPSVFFQEDKYGVTPEYYAHLHEVADKLQMCPDAKIIVTGINVDGKYGEQLAWNRVNKAIDYMTSKYGVSRDRFIIKFKQGEKAVTSIQKMEQRRVEFKVAQDGENGDSNPPAPHPGLKAGKEY